MVDIRTQMGSLGGGNGQWGGMGDLSRGLLERLGEGGGGTGWGVTKEIT
jgi:hypothetical protein